MLIVSFSTLIITFLVILINMRATVEDDRCDKIAYDLAQSLK